MSCLQFIDGYTQGFNLTSNTVVRHWHRLPVKEPVVALCGNVQSQIGGGMEQLGLEEDVPAMESL